MLRDVEANLLRLDGNAKRKIILIRLNRTKALVKAKLAATRTPAPGLGSVRSGKTTV